MPAKRKARRKSATVLLVGAGRMGTALLKGWIAKKLCPVVVVEPKPSAALLRLAKSHRVPLVSRIEDVAAERVGVCVIAVKPQILKEQDFSLGAFGQALIVSIAAGTRTQSLKRLCGMNARVVRAMPNLPGAIGRGITALYAAPGASPEDCGIAENLLGTLGEVVWVKREPLIDAVTAVSGSGPAYVFLLVEALARAAEAEGLPAGLAVQLARATVSGAGSLMAADRRPASELRRDVTSPGGTTQAALDVLMDDDAFGRLLRRAVSAARKRAEELSR